jgi:hypothetical protein
MKHFMDIPLGRFWRLTVIKHDVQNEYLVPENRLAGLIVSIANEPRVASFQCVPYHRTSFPDVWMTSGPSSLAAV